MLVTFNAISRHLADPDGPTMEIPTNVVAGLSGLMEYLHGQVIEPFFKNFRQDSMEAAWQSWTEWSKPLIDPLIDRVVNMSATTPELKELAKDADLTYPKLRDYLSTFSDELCEAFKASFKVGVKAEMTLLGHVAGIGSEAHLQDEMARNRLRSTIRFGLAVMLLEAFRIRGSQEPDKLKFLIKRLQKMGSVSLQNTLRFVRWAADGSSSETMEA